VPVSWFLAYQQRHEDERRDATSYSTDASEHLFAGCAGKAEAETLVCIAKAQEADREDRERQHDLKAQQDTAEWTAAGSILAGLGLIITAAGVIYVARTLEETRRANVTAREIGQKQVRAYLSVGSGRVMHLDLGLGDRMIPHLRFRFRIRNSGQSPAKQLQLSVECTIDVPGFRHLTRRVSIGISPIAAGAREWAEVYVNYNDGVAEPILALPDMLDVTMATLEIIARVDGFDVFERALDSATCAYSFRVNSFNADSWYPLERLTSELLAEREEQALREE
jgi:hypothetical protein